MSVGFLFHPAFLEHDTGPGHPECPQRLQAIVARLQATDLWAALEHAEPPPAALDTLELAHPRPYIEEIDHACRYAPAALDPDTIVSQESWDAALRAVGAVTCAIDRVLAGEWSSAFCAVRPPGHHAPAERAMGFCLFNAIAIGARYAQQRHRLSRVLIVDWDVHHGNGTQDLFYEDPSVFYFSTHQAPFYPGTGAHGERGAGHGRGATLNVALDAGSGDAEILAAFERELVPAADRFKPELVLISAGFDAHRDDPLAQLEVTEQGYARLTQIVRSIAERHCGGRVVSALEGGYDLGALGRSVEAHLRALLA